MQLTAQLVYAVLRPFKVRRTCASASSIVHALEVMVAVHQTVTADPIDYGPGIALMIRTPFGGGPAY